MTTRTLTATAGPRHRRRWPTPTRIRMMTVLIVLLGLVFGVVTTWAATGTRDGLRRAGDSGRVAMAISDLSFALTAMDAQAANALLLTPGADRAPALAAYEKRRAQADRDLRQAAADAADAETRRQVPVLRETLGRYEGLVAQALASDEHTRGAAEKPSPEATAVYDSATSTLERQLLPTAATLTQDETRALHRAYDGRRPRAGIAEAGSAVSGLALLVSLIGFQRWLSRRFRRRFNPALLMATAVAVVLTVGGTVLFAIEGRHMDVAGRDPSLARAFALSQARALSGDARAADSRSLVLSTGDNGAEDVFLEKSQQVILPATVSWVHQDYDASVIATQREFDATHSVRFSGVLAGAFRDSRSDRERAGDRLVLQRFAVFVASDEELGHLVTSGKRKSAVAYVTSSGGLGDHFDQYDTVLSRQIGLEEDRFTRSVQAGGNERLASATLPGLGVALIIGLTVAGARPRLAEYR